MGVHRTRRSSAAGALDRRRRKRLGSRYVSAVRCQIHQHLRDALIIVLVYVTFWQNGRSSGRLVNGTDNRTAGADGFRTLASCSIGVNPERRLRIGWWSINVHAVLLFPLDADRRSTRRVLPLAVAFCIHRTGRVWRFGFFLPLRTPTTAGATDFRHLHTWVRWKVWAWGPLRVGGRWRWWLTNGVSYALRRTVV